MTWSKPGVYVNNVQSAGKLFVYEICGNPQIRFTLSDPTAQPKLLPFAKIPPTQVTMSNFLSTIWSKLSGLLPGNTSFLSYVVLESYLGYGAFGIVFKAVEKVSQICQTYFSGKYCKPILILQ